MPHHEWDDARTAFEEASAFFVRTVRAITDGWDDHALGVWTLRDLVGHTSRALLTVEAYLAKPADVVTVSSPTDYFIEIMRAAGDPVAVAQRGRDAGAALGDEPATEVAVIADRVVDVVRRADGLQLLTCPVGGITLLDYLPTRTFELTVHTCGCRGGTRDDGRCSPRPRHWPVSP